MQRSGRFLLVWWSNSLCVCTADTECSSTCHVFRSADPSSDICFILSMIAEDGCYAEICQTLNKHVYSLPCWLYCSAVLMYTGKFYYQRDVELLLLRWHWIALGRTCWILWREGNTGLSKKMDGIWNRYNLKSTGRIYTFGVLKCSEKFKVLDLP
jgi:hypothetical protein